MYFIQVLIIYLISVKVEIQEFRFPKTRHLVVVVRTKWFQGMVVGSVGCSVFWVSTEIGT